MDIKRRTAAVSILLNILLTVFKYIAFLFTGSLAILGEAYHSLSDILTSILVYVSLKAKSGKPEKEKNQLPLENKISLGIGIFIFLVGIVFLINIFIYPIKIIKNPFISGIIFIIFSFGSYIVYCFETGVGKKEGSLGLIADGMHSKTDMITLITGFSLILYHMGINLDIPVAIFITLFIFSFAIETIINAFIYQKKDPDRSNILHYRLSEKITYLFNKELWVKIFSRININIMPWLKKPGHNVKKILFIIVALVLVLFYLSTSFYIISPYEEGKEKIAEFD